MHYIGLALISAFLFGASTPVGKILLDSLPPWQLAGLLYLGAAIGVLPFSIKRKTALHLGRIGRKNSVRLFGAIILGGVIGPVLLLFGLRMASSSSVAMWLNLELAATAVLGYFLFKDHLGRYGWIGVAGTLFASALLSWNEGGLGGYALLLVGGASLCWGFDNHLTALIDGITPAQSTFWKGITAGVVNLLISALLEPFSWAIWPQTAAVALGIFSYGFSISLYIFSAQHLGATRSQMLYASAPFFGVALSVMLLGEDLSSVQIMAALILVISLLVLFRDKHIHDHVHDRQHHKHTHRHDDKHHDHHRLGESVDSYHSHWHNHAYKVHGHPHWPDIHHRHEHGK